MQSGNVQAADGPLASAHPETLALIGLAFGDYIAIRSDIHDTLIVRQLQQLTVKGKFNREFLYLDIESMKLLGVGLREPIEVERSKFDLNMP